VFHLVLNWRGVLQVEEKPTKAKCRVNKVTINISPIFGAKKGKKGKNHTYQTLLTEQNCTGSIKI
jgi:hypothetical protein